MRRGVRMIREKTSMKLMNLIREKCCKRLRKRAYRVQSHRKVGQAKMCDEAFCLHYSRADED